MTEEDVLDLIREELEKNGGHARSACQKVAAHIGGHHQRLKAFWRRFGTEAVLALERRHQTSVRSGRADTQEAELPENHGRDGRAEAIAARGPENRFIALGGRRVRLSEVTGLELVEHGRDVIEHARKELETGKTYVAIGETAGASTLAETWGDLTDEQRAFLTRRTEPHVRVA